MYMIIVRNLKLVLLAFQFMEQNLKNLYSIWVAAPEIFSAPQTQNAAEGPAFER